MKEYGKWDGEKGFDWYAWGGGRTRQMYKCKADECQVIKSYIWKVSKEMGLNCTTLHSKNQSTSENWLGMQISKLRYAEIEF